MIQGHLNRHPITTTLTDATHQKGKHLIMPDNIPVRRLPPYAPELNPMGNVWSYLRTNKPCALVWDSYDAIVDACGSAWCFLVNDPKRIQSIGIRN